MVHDALWCDDEIACGAKSTVVRKALWYCTVVRSLWACALWCAALWCELRHAALLCEDDSTVVLRVVWIAVDDIPPAGVAEIRVTELRCTHCRRAPCGQIAVDDGH